MRIWILQTGEPIHCDKGNIRPMRAINLSNKLIENGHQVTLFSSSFNHQTKTHRIQESKEIIVNENLKIILLDSPGYKNNVGLTRILDHLILGLNLDKKLKKIQDLPQVAFVGYPPIETAHIFIRWLQKNNIPVLIDIKDQWPTIFVSRMLFVFKPFMRFFLIPYYFFAKKTIKNATAVISISEPFIKWSRFFSASQPSQFDKVTYLTSPTPIFTDDQLKNSKIWWNNKGIVKSDKFKIIFIGSFSKSFDFQTILNSALELKKKNIECEFILCGYGELFSRIEQQAKQMENVKVFGFVDQAKILALSKMASMYIAPYRNTNDFKMSIPNKIIDSLRMGLPILTPLKGELKNIINNSNAGFIYSDKQSLINFIETSINDSKMLAIMSKNARKLYLDEFDFHTVYDSLVDHIENFTLDQREANRTEIYQKMKRLSHRREKYLSQ